MGAVGGLEGERAVGEGHQEAIRAVDRVQAGERVLGLEWDLVPVSHCMQWESNAELLVAVTITELARVKSRTTTYMFRTLPES